MRYLISIIFIFFTLSANAQLFLDGEKVEVTPRIAEGCGIEIYKVNEFFVVKLDVGRDYKTVTDGYNEVIYFRSIGDVYPFLYDFGIKLNWGNNEVDVDRLANETNETNKT